MNGHHFRVVGIIFEFGIYKGTANYVFMKSTPLSAKISWKATDNDEIIFVCMHLDGIFFFLKFAETSEKYSVPKGKSDCVDQRLKTTEAQFFC